MKTTITFTPFFALLTAAALDPYYGQEPDFLNPYWMSLTDAACTDIQIVDGFSLVAQCENPQEANSITSLRLELDRCFANNHGKLEYVPHGNFSWGCGACDIDRDYIFTCQCQVSKGGFPQETSYNLNDASIITLTAERHSYVMDCHLMEDM